MATDFTKTITDEISKKFNAAVSSDRKIKIIKKKITLGRAKQSDISKLADLLGNHASKAFTDVLPDYIPDTTLYYDTAKATLSPVMNDINNRINVAGAIQQALKDTKAGLKINLTEGTNSAIESYLFDVSNAKDYKAVINNETGSTARKMYDEFQLENVALRNNMGYTCYVTRTYDDVGLHGKGETCHFCKDREGTFEYPGEANDADVFARHPGCGCTITFTTEKGTQMQKDWTHNEWI